MKEGSTVTAKVCSCAFDLWSWILFAVFFGGHGTIPGLRGCEGLGWSSIIDIWGIEVLR